MRKIIVIAIILGVSAGAYAAIGQAFSRSGFSAGHAQVVTITVDAADKEILAVYGAYKSAADLAAGEYPLRLIQVQVPLTPAVSSALSSLESAIDAEIVAQDSRFSGAQVVPSGRFP